MIVHISARLIQEEKETTEQRAEELESRVGSGSLDAMAARWHAQNQADRPFERSNSPPLSGRSTPNARPSYQTHSLQKYHTLSGDTVSTVIPRY